MIAATPASSKRRARSRAERVEVFGPAVGCHETFTRVDADGDAAGEGAAGGADQVGVFDGGAAEDDAADAGGEPGLDAGQVADAAAKLHGDAGSGEDGGDGGGVDRAAGEGAVQVDHVQPWEPGVLPGAGLGGGVVGVDRRLIHGAALEADAGAVLQVDGGVEGEAGHGPM